MKVNSLWAHPKIGFAGEGPAVKTQPCCTRNERDVQLVESPSDSHKHPSRTRGVVREVSARRWPVWSQHRCHWTLDRLADRPVDGPPETALERWSVCTSKAKAIEVKLIRTPALFKPGRSQNPVWLHSTLLYTSPVAYEQAFTPENVLVVHKP